MRCCTVITGILISALAAGGSTGWAYPGGPSISTGTNPVLSVGGQVERNHTETVLTADGAHDVVLTDVSLTPAIVGGTDCSAGATIRFLLSSGEEVARYVIGFKRHYNNHPTNMPNAIDSHLRSGLRVPAGLGLQMEVSNTFTEACTNWYIAYTLSGYRAES